jgi:hypothetical protein
MKLNGVIEIIIINFLFFFKRENKKKKFKIFLKLKIKILKLPINLKGFLKLLFLEKRISLNLCDKKLIIL